MPPVLRAKTSEASKRSKLLLADRVFNARSKRVARTTDAEFKAKTVLFDERSENPLFLAETQGWWFHAPSDRVMDMIRPKRFNVMVLTRNGDETVVFATARDILDNWHRMIREMNCGNTLPKSHFYAFLD